MEKNREVSEKYDSFDIADLPTYGYTYKDEEKTFEKDFNFVTALKKEVQKEGHKESVTLARPNYLEKEDDMQMAKRPFSFYKSPSSESQEMSFRRNRILAEEHKAFDYTYSLGEEQAVFVNALQYPYIKKRKERRDYLDSLEKKKNLGYQHESRHKHAMKRPRAPSGRFLTKEEAQRQERKERKE